MKLKKTLVLSVALLLIVMVIAAVYGIFSLFKFISAGPGSVIDDDQGDYIEFSEKAGIYGHPVSITIESHGNVGNIYYTTDCSKPTEDDNLYTGESIDLDLVSGKEKAYVIRAAGISDNGTYTTKEIVSTYIISENADSRYTTAIISLVTEKSNLYDKMTGIFSSANIYGTGIEYERDIHLEYFEPDGELIISQHGGIRIFGGYSRAHSQKSVRLYARNIYDDTGIFSFNPLINERGRYTGKLIFEYQKLLFRNSGNDWCVTQFRDALIQRIAGRTVLDYQDYRPMAVYLNGDYYGLLNFREDMGTKYFENHYGVPEEGVTIISSHLQDARIPKDKTQYVLDAGEPSELDRLKKDLEFAYTADMTISDNYKEVCDRIDVENFAQYMMLQIYISNTDWPHNNIRIWRYNPLYDNKAPVGTGNCGFDGKWRFVLKDTDFGMNMYADNNPRHNTLSHALNSGDVFGLGKVLKNLIKNESFKELFITTMCDFLNYAAEPDYLVQLISEMQIGISGEISYHLKKWIGNSNTAALKNWDTEVDKMRQFAEKRPEYLTAYFKSTFKLGDQVTLTVKGSEHGTFYINSIPVKSDEEKTFRYFPGIRINVTWKADPGYTFLYYYTYGSIEFNDHSFIIQEDSYIEPVFAEDPDFRKTLVINEYMSSSTKDSGYDWVEIYNNTDKTISLKDYFLTDSQDNIDKWQFPGYVIKSGEYIVIRLTGEDRFTGYDNIHTNFKISEGETLFLVYRDGSITDSVKIENCESDPNGNVLTVGRYPNAVGDFIQLNSKSPGADNIYTEYERYIHPSLRNRVVITGVLQDTGYYAYLQDGVPYISTGTDVYSASEYADIKKLRFIYVYSIDSVVFTKK